MQGASNQRVRYYAALDKILTYFITVVFERPEDLAGVGIGILRPFNLPVCIECQYCIQSTNLYAHIHGHKLAAKNVFTKETQEAMIRKYRLSIMVPKPHDGGSILPTLQQIEGMACKLCPFKSISDQMIRRHRSSHQDKACMEAVLLQTFFAAKTAGIEGGGYIQVKRLENIRREKPSDFIKDMLTAQQDSYNPPIIDQEDPRTVAPFAHISEWADWVNQYPAAVLRQLRDKETYWKILPGMVNDVLALFIKSKDLCTFINSGIRCHLATSK